MNLYKCKVIHRHDDNFHSKVFWIEADCALAAYIKAQEITRNIDTQVFPPTIELYIPPKPDYTCTLNQVIEEYGTRIYNEIKSETRYCSWRDDRRKS